MTPTISAMIDGILAREGGFVNHPSDPGGATRYGITQRTARANGYTGDMRYLPLTTAREIYYREYVERPKFTGIAERDAIVAEEVIDSGVNAGPDRAARWFQMALNVFNRRQQDYSDIAVDGDIGPKTLAAFDALQRRRSAILARLLLLRMLDGLQIGHYYALSEGNTKFEDFTPGWVLNRIGNAA